MKDGPRDPSAAKAWRRKHDPKLVEYLQARLSFLRSRVNWKTDPAIQKLIAETQALLAKPKHER